jgi:murein DD-endopeptidase MepM/ murein hydrolase activator NlpD
MARSALLCAPENSSEMQEINHLAGRVRSLIGQANLYSALQSAADGLTDAQVETFLSYALQSLSMGNDSENLVAERLQRVDQALLRAVIRKGAGLPAVYGSSSVTAHLATVKTAPLFQPDVRASRTMALLTSGQLPDMPAFSDKRFDDWFARQDVTYGLGPYGEKRSVYETAQFADAASPERRTVHLGIDVFAPYDTPLFAPLAGIVRSVTYNSDPLDYGNTLIIEHSFGEISFWTLYGHLSGTLPALCQLGMPVAQGQLIAHLGNWHENGGWAAHVHFQVMTTLLDQTDGNFFGVGHESLWDLWSEICPDPDLVLRIGAERFNP